MAKKHDIYLDYAAATPVDERVLAAMQPYFSNKFHNPSSDYSPARQAKTALEESRKTIAAFIGAKPAEIIFTAGGSEANNLAILGVAGKHPGKHIIATAIEHDSVLKPLEYLARNGWQTTLVKPAKDGIIDADTVLAQITDDTVLLCVMHANNEVGSIQPLSQIAKQVQFIRRDRLKRGVKTPLYLHSDACQATQYLDMHASRLGVDSLVFNSDKIYGPKQCGALFVRGGTQLDPLVRGGDQESGLRSGTQNVPAIVGFAEAIKLTEKIKDQETQRMKQLQKYLVERIGQIDGAHINGPAKRRLPNNLNVTFPGADNERLLMQLDEEGIYVSAGSACGASKNEPSYVLRAMGFSEDHASSSIRISMGRQTTEDDIKKTINIVKHLVDTRVGL